MEKINISNEKQSKIFRQMKPYLRNRTDMMKDSSYANEEGKRMDKQLVASHCLKEDIEGRRKGSINFLLEIRFAIL
jgi:hypothetical protein